MEALQDDAGVDTEAEHALGHAAGPVLEVDVADVLAQQQSLGTAVQRQHGLARLALGVEGVDLPGVDESGAVRALEVDGALLVVLPGQRGRQVHEVP